MQLISGKSARLLTSLGVMGGIDFLLISTFGTSTSVILNIMMGLGMFFQFFLSCSFAEFGSDSPITLTLEPVKDIFRSDEDKEKINIANNIKNLEMLKTRALQQFVEQGGNKDRVDDVLTLLDKRQSMEMHKLLKIEDSGYLSLATPKDEFGYTIDEGIQPISNFG